MTNKNDNGEGNKEVLTMDRSRSKSKKGKAKRRDESETERGYMEGATFTFRKERGEEAEIPSTRGKESRKGGGEGVKGDQLPPPFPSLSLLRL